MGWIYSTSCGQATIEAEFDLMTFIVWITSKLSKGTKPIVNWIGIIIASIIFAIEHFPIVYQIIEFSSMALLTYILIGNTIGGQIFDWLNWKKGLESAIIAHVCAHIVLDIGESIMKIA